MRAANQNVQPQLLAYPAVIYGEFPKIATIYQRQVNEGTESYDDRMVSGRVPWASINPKR